MPVVMTTAMVVSGDVGGDGISRLNWSSSSGGLATSAECDTAGGAAAAMLATMSTLMPDVISWQVQPVYEGHQLDTGLVAGTVGSTVVIAPVIGGDPNGYAAGMGARGYWHTTTVHGRRVVRGALYVVPLKSPAYALDGALLASTATTVQGAMQTYVTTMVAAGLDPVVWHRPPKGTFAGGIVAPINTATCGTKPGGLRSRRS